MYQTVYLLFRLYPSYIESYFWANFSSFKRFLLYRMKPKISQGPIIDILKETKVTDRSSISPVAYSATYYSIRSDRRLKIN